MNERKAPIPPLLVLLIGILAVSTSSIFIRNAQADAPSLIIAAYRLTLATLLISPLALTHRRSELSALHRKELGLALLSGFFLAIHFATWITSLEFTTVTSSVVLVTTTPLWVALFSPWTIKEPITKPIVIGMVFALAGGILIGLNDVCTWNDAKLACQPMSNLLQGSALLGDLLALMGAWAAAGYILIGRRLRSNLSLVGYIFIVYGMAALVLIGFAKISGAPFFGYTPATYLWFLLLALVPQLLGHSSFNYALGYLSAAYVSISLLGEPIGSTILAFFLLNETPSSVEIIGAILVMIGIYIASRRGS